MDPELFNDLKASIRQMKAIEKGALAPARLRVINLENEVTRARMKLGLTQEEFAKLMDTPVGTIRGWEQGRRLPPSSAKVLIRVATNYPENVLECAQQLAEESAVYNSGRSK
jgi:putative transcriptional regulator